MSIKVAVIAVCLVAIQCVSALCDEPSVTTGPDISNFSIGKLRATLETRHTSLLAKKAQLEEKMTKVGNAHPTVLALQKEFDAEAITVVESLRAMMASRKTTIFEQRLWRERLETVLGEYHDLVKPLKVDIDRIESLRWRTRRPKLPNEDYAEVGKSTEDFDPPLYLGFSGPPGMPIFVLRIPKQPPVHVGGDLKVELIVVGTSPGSKFSMTAEIDAGLTVVILGNSGKRYFANSRGSREKSASRQVRVPIHSAVMLKEFSIRFDAPNEQRNDDAEAFVELPPGDYSLSVYWDAGAGDEVHEGEWALEMDSGPRTFKLLSAANKPANTNQPVLTK